MSPVPLFGSVPGFYALHTEREPRMWLMPSRTEVEPGVGDEMDTLQWRQFVTIVTFCYSLTNCMVVGGFCGNGRNT